VNFLIAVVIGVVAGFAGWFVIREKQAKAIWLGPVLGVVGALIASGLATAFGTPGYGLKEFALQVVLAAAGVGALVAVTMRRTATPAGSSVTSGATNE